MAAALRMTGHAWRSASLLLAACMAATAAHAVDEDAMTKSTDIVRTDSAPVIDGTLDDDAWASARVISDFHQMKPVEYAEVSGQTDILLLYDADALYFGIRAYDDSPDNITARVLRQGEGLRGEDRIRILLGPFNDNRSGYLFMVNANSVRLDGIYKDGDFDSEWTGIWQTKARVTEDGWEAEVRIPFKTLSFEANRDWAINFTRVVARTQEEMAWVSRNRSTNPAIVGTLTGLRDLSQGKGLDIVPALSVTGSRNRLDNTDDTTVEPSLDLFYKLTPGLNASLTFNTDFSATEVDSRQVNLTRFGLFFPEKRAFFLRESDIFEFGGISGDDNTVISRGDLENGRPYFSRRIGLGATGEPVDLEAGAKLSGRHGRWNIGAQYIRQSDFEDIEATDIFVGRVAANVLRESALGFIVTSGDPRSNLDNSVVGVDFLYRNTRLQGGREIDANLWYQQSNTSGISGDDAAFGLSLRSPNNAGWRGGLGFKEIQENFNPALGFVSRSGVRQALADVGYTWHINANWIRSIAAGIDTQRIEYIDGRLQSQRINLKPIELENTTGDEFSLSYREDKEQLTESFEISDGIVIPVGTYENKATAFSIETSEHRVIGFEFEYLDGDFFNGSIRSTSVELEWKPSRHFATEISFSTDSVDLPQGSFTTRLARARFDIVFSNTLSWMNLIQYDNVSESIGLNSRLRWVPQAGRNVYLVFNHNFVERPLDGDFHSTTSDLTVKADYTFRF